MRATRYPGVKQIGEKQFRIRGKFLDPRSGSTKEVQRNVEAGSAKEAAAIRANLLEEAEAAVTTQRMTVTGFARLWLQSKNGVVSKYTLESYTSILEQHVLPRLGDFYYDQIGPMEVQQWVNLGLKLKNDEGKPRYSRRSVEDWFRVFRNMTRDAIAQLGLLRDPTLRVRFPQDPWTDESELEQEDDILELDEVHRFLDAMKRSRPASYAMTMTLGLTGQRFCHVSALKWGDIDFEQMMIRFRRKQVRGEIGPISRRKPAPREIPMLPELAQALLEHRDRQQRLDERGSGDGHGTSRDDFVFMSNVGSLRQPANVYNAFKAALKEAGIKKRVRPHGLRYFFNDVLRLAGIDSVSARSITGHVTEEMRAHYSTVRLDEKRTVMEKVAQKLRDARSSDSAVQVVELVVSDKMGRKGPVDSDEKAA